MWDYFVTSSNSEPTEYLRELGNRVKLGFLVAAVSPLCPECPVCPEKERYTVMIDLKTKRTTKLFTVCLKIYVGLGVKRKFKFKIK